MEDEITRQIVGLLLGVGGGITLSVFMSRCRREPLLWSIWLWLVHEAVYSAVFLLSAYSDHAALASIDFHMWSIVRRAHPIITIIVLAYLLRSCDGQRGVGSCN